MIRRFLATKPKFGSSTAPPTVPVKGFLFVLAGIKYRKSRKIPFFAVTRFLAHFAENFRSQKWSFWAYLSTNGPFQTDEFWNSKF